MNACMNEKPPRVGTDTIRRATTRALDLSRARMFRNLANKLYGASAVNAPHASTTHDASASSSSSSSASASSDTADAPRPTTTFADRFVMSWNEEDVAFMGEDPYGDCAGNVFAQAAAESRRRAAAEAEAAREGEPRASVDGGSRRASVDEAREARERAEEKTRAFFRIGPT